ncbi:hypothetical protein ACRBEV_17355 [Methylobacterium phyllosphaerae]
MLTLSGEALDVPAYEALRAALSNPPEGFSIGRIEILPPRVAAYRFAVEKSARGLVLDGFAPSAADREAALRAATEAAAGGTVEDRLLAARGLDPAIDPKSLIAFAFKLAELIQSGTVVFTDGAVSVTGDAIDGQAIPDAAALMRDSRPAGVAAGTVALTARPLSPYRVAIRRTADAVTVTGHMPDTATRERVLAALRPRLFREPIIDRTRLADGAPPDLGDALAAAAPLVTNLADGTVSVSDRALTLTGESLYREGAARAPDRLAESLPPGWTAQAHVTARDAAERRDPATCRADVSAILAGADLRFPAGGAVLTPSFYPTLDALAALAKTCPSLRIAVSGPADPAKPPPTPAAGPAAGEGAPAVAPAQVASAARPDAQAPPTVPGKPAAEAKDVAKAGSSKASSSKANTTEADASGKDTARERGKTDHGKPDHGKLDHKAEAGKPASTKTDAAKKETAAHGKAAARKPAETPEEPPLDLPRLRAQAVVEYLLQAGARPEQVGAGPDGPAGPIVFALLP